MANSVNEIVNLNTLLHKVQHNHLKPGRFRDIAISGIIKTFHSQ